MILRRKLRYGFRCRYLKIAMTAVRPDVDTFIQKVYNDVSPFLNERQKRILAGSIAAAYGFGGIKKICSISGLDYKTVKSGAADKENKPAVGTNALMIILPKTACEGKGRDARKLKRGTLTLGQR